MDSEIYIYEPTFTDLFILELKKKFLKNVFIRKTTSTEEAANGADFLFLLADENLFFGIPLIIQAKRLDHKKGSKRTRHTILNRIKCSPKEYPSIGKKAGTHSSNYQIDLLISQNPGTVPIYFFYNCWCDPDPHRSDFGISVSNAIHVRHELRRGGNLNNKSIKYNQMNYIRFHRNFNSNYLNSIPIHQLFKVNNYNDPTIINIRENIQNLLHTEHFRLKKMQNFIIEKFRDQLISIINENLFSFLFFEGRLNIGRVLILVKILTEDNIHLFIDPIYIFLHENLNNYGKNIEQDRIFFYFINFCLYLLHQPKILEIEKSERFISIFTSYLDIIEKFDGNLTIKKIISKLERILLDETDIRSDEYEDQDFDSQANMITETFTLLPLRPFEKSEYRE